MSRANPIRSHSLHDTGKSRKTLTRKRIELGLTHFGYSVDSGFIVC